MIISGNHSPLAPDQNRTDTRSLEGYCSTIELQAQDMKRSMQNHLIYLQARNFQGDNWGGV